MIEFLKQIYKRLGLEYRMQAGLHGIKLDDPDMAPGGVDRRDELSAEQEALARKAIAETLARKRAEAAVRG